MANGKLFTKTSNEVGIWGFNWALVLEDGETISESNWSATPSGLTLANGAINSTQTVIQISGGDDKTRYRVVNIITIDNGEVWERFFDIRVDDIDSLS